MASPVLVYGGVLCLQLPRYLFVRRHRQSFWEYEEAGWLGTDYHHCPAPSCIRTYTVDALAYG